MRRLHLVTGLLSTAAFLSSGMAMRLHTPALPLLAADMRLMYISRHIYILAAGLVNLSLGLYLAARPAGWRRSLQIPGSALVILAPVLLVLAFLAEPARGIAGRSWLSKFGLFALFGGVMAHLLSAAGGKVRVLALVLLASVSASAAPCITAAADCTEWIPLGGGTLGGGTLGGGTDRSLVYRTYSLDARNEQIVRALIMIHGSGRDADNYFRTAVAAAFLAGRLDDTVVIAPRFASNDGRGCRDPLAPHEVSWSCSGDSWRSGGKAGHTDRLTSYDFADEILRRLARKDLFPNLRSIVVAGHSAGGQFVTRYEMANQVHDALGVAIAYVVANPSSYAYLDPLRPSADGARFAPFRDARNCTTYDRWPYGLENRTGYTARLSDSQLKKQLAARPVAYLLGEIDILPLGGFDSSCPAMAQGPTRLARGQAYARYVNQNFGAQHKVTVVPLCGHNARCMFTSEAALPIIFPKL